MDSELRRSMSVLGWQETFRPDRYARVRQEFSLGKTVYMPYLGFGCGRTHIIDGRHRLYPTSKKGEVSLPELRHINVRHLGEMMDSVFMMLGGIYSWLGELERNTDVY